MKHMSLSITCDRALIEAKVAAQRTLEWTIGASALPQRSERAPLNLALILDRSGSMSGDKIAYVQKAACHVLDQLDEGDRVAVVAYDDEVTLIAPSTNVSAANSRELKGKIMGLYPGGWTDLSGGWLKGCAEVAGQQQANGVNRALLLTDGLANRGITDMEELTHHARELRKRGISTSTFGVGLDFNEHLLEALAANGGGHFYFIERPDQIPGFFRSELGELLTVVAREASLSIELPAGVGAELLGGLPHEAQDGRLQLPLGDLCENERRLLYTRVLTPPGVEGATLRLKGELSYLDLAGARQSVSAELALVYAPQQTVQAAPQDQELLARASEVDVAKAMSEALKLEREGQRDQAVAHMRQSLAANAPHMPAPAATAYQDVVDLMLDEAPLTEEKRKETHFAAYKKRTSR